MKQEGLHEKHKKLQDGTLSDLHCYAIHGEDFFLIK
jgi:hypothetical protein